MSWTTIGSVRENKKGNFNLIVNKNIEILVDGEALDLGQYRMLSLFDSTSGAQGLFDRGSIDQEVLEKKLAYIGDKKIKYDVTLAPQNG